MNRPALVPALLAAACSLHAGGALTWEMTSYADFVKGRFEGVSLTRDGALRLAAEARPVFATGQPVIWSVARAGDGALYLGTGHRGQVYRVTPDGRGELAWTADEPEVFAVASGPKGAIYAATSPKGRVYRIEGGKATEYFAPPDTYIWALAAAPDGTLYVGTGNEGRVYRVDAPGKGGVFYETGQGHVTCLGLDPAGRVLAGTEPNGILYRIDGNGKAFVLYDANLPEIRSVAVLEDGSIYAAALGGSVARRAAAAVPAPGGSPRVQAPATSITVTAASEAIEIKPKAEAPKPAAPVPAAELLAPPAVEMAGVEKSALYRIRNDNTVETLWTSTEENAYDLLVTGRGLFFTTDQDGRLYHLDPDRKVSLIAQTNEAEATRLLADGTGLFVATGNMGRLVRLGDRLAPSGAYEAPVHDASKVARWGRLSWERRDSAGGALEFQTRSGNSPRPDPTWSDWSAPLADPEGCPVASPSARYIQWRAALRGVDGRSPELDGVTLAYLPQNDPPRVTSVSVGSQAVARTAEGTAAASSTSTAAYSITVTDSGAAGPSTSSGTPTQKLTRSLSDKIQISWQAEDPDGDRLAYSLYFRGVGEREWKLIKPDLETTTHSIDSDALADDRYLFRVVASDGRVNPPGAAREAECVSAPVLVDHTPPVVAGGVQSRDGRSAAVTFRAEDAASALARAEYSLDAGAWVPVASQDGIVDSRREEFQVRLDSLAPGEHLLVLRVQDSAENAGLAKVVLR